MTDRLAELLERGGSSPETARNVVHVLEQLDPVELVDAIQGGGPSTSEGRELPLAVSALEAEPPAAASFDVNGMVLRREIHLMAGEGGV